MRWICHDFHFSLKYLDSDVLHTESKSKMEMNALMPDNGLTNYLATKSVPQYFDHYESFLRFFSSNLNVQF